MSHIAQQYWGTDITSVITNSHSSKPTPSTPASQTEIEDMLKPYFIGYLI